MLCALSTNEEEIKSLFVELTRCIVSGPIQPRVTETVYAGHFDVPKTQRSQRSVPLSAKAIQILAARKPAVMNPEALVFATSNGTPFDRHNLTNKHLKPTCKKLNLVGVSWHWLTLSAHLWARCKLFSGILLRKSPAKCICIPSRRMLGQRSKKSRDCLIDAN